MASENEMGTSGCTESVLTQIIYLYLLPLDGYFFIIRKIQLGSIYILNSTVWKMLLILHFLRNLHVAIECES